MVYRYKVEEDPVHHFHITCNEQQWVQAGWLRSYALWHVRRGQEVHSCCPELTLTPLTSSRSKQSVTDVPPLRTSGCRW